MWDMDLGQALHWAVDSCLDLGLVEHVKPDEAHPLILPGRGLVMPFLLSSSSSSSSPSDSFDQLQLTNGGLATCTVLLIIFTRVYGVLALLRWPVLTLAFFARMVLGVYQTVNMLMDLALATAILLFLVIEDRVHTLFSHHRQSPARLRLKAAETYSDYRRTCIEVDKAEGRLAWREEERDFPQAVLLHRSIQELDAALQNKNIPHLKFLLGGVFRRNHMGIDTLHRQCLSGSKLLILSYREKIQECLHFITASSELPKEEKETFLRGARRSLGRTALCLSGGGGITCYHLGVVRALIEVGLFRYIRVVTGASGGSILAALIAIHTEEELLRDVLTEDFTTDFKGGGRMEAEKIDWFFKVRPFPIARLLLNVGLLDKEQFERTAEFYLGDMTFSEAFAKTKRHVNISVSTSSLEGYTGADELLLNHLTTPTVLIRSAVVASSSLPGIFKPSKLLSKNTEGQIGSFYLEGVQWIDGSIQADIPFRGISTMFSVSNYIVSQVNFHVVPFLNDDQTKWLHKNWYWDLFKMLAMDIKYRAVALRQLKLFPTFYGQDISKVFDQKYSGDVTIVPPFRLLDSWGTNAILVPGKEGMRYYLETGRRSLWKHMDHIWQVMAIEIELARCLSSLAAGVPLPPLPLHLSTPLTMGRRGSVSVGGGGAGGGEEGGGTLTESPPTLAAMYRHWGSRTIGGGGGEGEEGQQTRGVARIGHASTRQLSLGASLISVLDEDDDLLSLMGGSIYTDGEPPEETNDDDMVNQEYKFVGKPSRRASKRRDPVGKPKQGAAAVGAREGEGEGEGKGEGEGGAGAGARRPRILSAATGETIVSALTNRMKWLEEENRKLTYQLSHTLPFLDMGKLHEAMPDEFSEDRAAGGQGENVDECESESEDEGRVPGMPVGRRSWRHMSSG